jgi:hypothetical protein
VVSSFNKLLLFSSHELAEIYKSYNFLLAIAVSRDFEFEVHLQLTNQVKTNCMAKTGGADRATGPL